MANHKAQNPKILITAGPTREHWDPVRYLTNPSSGAMGIELARALRKKGAKVTLILGPTTLKAPAGVKTISVVSALDMSSAVKKLFSNANAFVATAAVGDWRFASPSKRKIKKTAAATATVKLVKNPDILADAAARKKKGQIVVGFALETNSAIAHARAKLRRKNLDLIIANGPASFASGRIHPIWIEKQNGVKKLSLMPKPKLAALMADWIFKQWKTR